MVATIRSRLPVDFVTSVPTGLWFFRSGDSENCIHELVFTVSAIASCSMSCGDANVDNSTFAVMG